MTFRSRYVIHWFDIKVLSVRILLKEALVLTNRYFVFVFVFLGYRHYLVDLILESIPIGSWHCCNCTMKFRKGLHWDLSNTTSQSRNNVMTPTKFNYLFFLLRLLTLRTCFWNASLSVKSSSPPAPTWCGILSLAAKFKVVWSNFPVASNPTSLISMWLDTASIGIFPHHRWFIRAYFVEGGVVVGSP